jgi:hypothetical protein
MKSLFPAHRTSFDQNHSSHSERTRNKKSLHILMEPSLLGCLNVNLYNTLDVNFDVKAITVIYGANIWG